LTAQIKQIWSKLFSDFVTTDEIILSLDFQMLKIQTRTFFGIGSSNWNKKKLEDTVESFFSVLSFLWFQNIVFIFNNILGVIGRATRTV
jgi:hypothetical protein